MKKLMLVMFLFTVFGSKVLAQDYATNKLTYDPRFYMPQYGDPYNPALSGVASFFMPGLGQILLGETSRGVAFIGGGALCGSVMLGGALVYSVEMMAGDVPVYGGLMMLIGGVSYFAIDLWSVVDAVNVAKVNNMYIQDMRSKKDTGFEMRLSPYIDNLSINNMRVTPVGLKLSVTF